jgi:hypothetical protein
MKWLAWALAALGLVFGLLGEPTGWYRQYAWYDELLHAHTSFWVTVLIALYARETVFRQLGGHAFWKVVLVAAAGVGVGVVWEIGEWLFDQTIGGPTVKSRYDTSIDLFVDTVAASVSSLIAMRLPLAQSLASGRRHRGAEAGRGSGPLPRDAALAAARLSGKS